jgi:DNA-binding LacI/PurR family transcriptional regulator
MPKIRHVALLIETSKSYGRGLLRGIAQYIKEHEPWSVFLEPRALMTSPPSWLKSWKGDGILARISDADIAGVVFKTDLPAVNLSSAIPNLGFPCIETDPERLASLALAHLLGRGLRRFRLSIKKQGGGSLGAGTESSGKLAATSTETCWYSRSQRLAGPTTLGRL